MFKILKRMFIWFIGLVILGVLIGSVYQFQYDRKIRNSTPSFDFMEIDGNKVHYKLTGNGNTTFVLISGLGNSMQTWSPISDKLGESGRVLTFDRPGLGLSEGTSTERTTPFIVAELHDLLTGLGVQENIILVGHSMGGAHARYYAHKYPEQVSGVFLIDPYLENRVGAFPDLSFKQQLINTFLIYFSWTGFPGKLLADQPPAYRTTRHIRTYGREKKGIYPSYEMLRKTKLNINSIPIMILWIADKERSDFEHNQKVFDTIMGNNVSSFSALRTLSGNHFIHENQPDLVLRELDEFVHEIRKSPDLK